MFASNEKLQKLKDEKFSDKNMTPIQELYDRKKSSNNMTPSEELERRKKGYSEIWEGDENFKSAMVRMFDREKGHVNDKDNLGGETNLGITTDTHFSPDTIKRAREFIQGSEGFSDIAYQDKAGVWTIGYGHTGYIYENI